MDWYEASQIAKEIIELKSSDEDFNELRRDFVLSAFRYSNIRFEWYMSSIDNRREIEGERSILHNSFISSCNALLRYIRKIDPDSIWTEKFPADRKEVGDFACYLCAWISIRAR